MNFCNELIFSKAARYDSLSQFAPVDVNNGQGNLDSNKKGKHAVRVLPLACEQSSCMEHKYSVYVFIRKGQIN